MTTAEAAAAEAAAHLANFAAEFTDEDAPLAAAFVRAEAAASARIAGFAADSRETGLAALGLAASSDARAAASILSATRLAVSGRPADSVHAAVDPGGDDGSASPAGSADFAGLAIAHASFVAARPYFLGNARTARALSVAGLSALGLAGAVPVPLSAGLLVDVPGYRVALDEFAAGDTDPIVHVFARAAHAAVDNARELATALTITLAEWDDAMVGVRSHASSRQLVAVVLESPVIDARVAVSALGVTLAAAYTSIETLVDRGILEPRGPERRNRAWFAPGVLDALDAFVARAR